MKLREVLLSTFCMSFILTSVWINIELSTNLDRNHDMEQRDRVHVFPGVEDEPAHHRQRRQVTTLADWVSELRHNCTINVLIDTYIILLIILIIRIKSDCIAR